jgi:hypothetical protein
MAVTNFACVRFCGRHALLTLAFSASLAMSLGPTAQGEERFAEACALKDIKVIALIEEHGAAGDLSSDRLGDAGLTMLRARAACYQGRVGEALALYQSIFDLGPVTSLRRR